MNLPDEILNKICRAAGPNPHEIGKIATQPPERNWPSKLINVVVITAPRNHKMTCGLFLLLRTLTENPQLRNGPMDETNIMLRGPGELSPGSYDWNESDTPLWDHHLEVSHLVSHGEQMIQIFAVILCLSPRLRSVLIQMTPTDPRGGSNTRASRRYRTGVLQALQVVKIEPLQTLGPLTAGNVRWGLSGPFAGAKNYHIRGIEARDLVRRIIGVLLKGLI